MIDRQPTKLGALEIFWRQFRRHRLAAAGAVAIGVFASLALAAKWISPYDPIAQDLSAQLQRPSRAHWLGTDEFGRDIWSRILYGGRISIFIGIVSVGLGLVVGGLMGLIAGYHLRLDNVLMRVVEVLQAFPGILLAIAVVAVLGPGLLNAMIAVGLRAIPSYARIVRSVALGLRGRDFVEAARAAGASDSRILFRHILPNGISTVLVFSSLQVANAILLAAILSFLGLGVQPPTPEWGKMVADGRAVLRTAPHVATFPGLAIFLTVMAFNLVGDGLRDSLDPRLRGV
jgi:ABC-type dipeptide/oligopeptide/nickel transport system permease subunit